MFYSSVGRTFASNEIICKISPYRRMVAPAACRGDTAGAAGLARAGVTGGS